MIAYLCKYAPIEIFESMGTETEIIMPHASDFNQADTLMHPNICSFIKGVLEEYSVSSYDGIILTNCCDSTRRLYDVLKQEYPQNFIYMVDVPRKKNRQAAECYAESIRKMTNAYSKFSGIPFKEQEFRKFLIKKAEQQVPAEVECNAELRVGLMGARCSSGVLELLEKYNIDISLDMTCTGTVRRFMPEQDNGDVIADYAEELLGQLPCMRMVDYSEREKFLSKFTENIDGIIYHTVKFCDNYSYEYAYLRETMDMPIQKFETDSTLQSEGQIRTRLEAFLESLLVAKGLPAENIMRHSGDNNMKKNEIKRVLGIDSGSTSTNAVIMNADRSIEAYAVVRTGAKSSESAKQILDEVLAKASLTQDDIDLIVSTGYGRVSIPFADRNVTEISCHGKGAHYFYPEARTILDIGGQDSKAIRLNEKGDVIDFVMNDKCAAGTGRFLEMMARTLEIDIKELGPVSLDWKEDIDISSMCSVFAESEVISLIANNKEKSDIAHGIHKAIASKSISLMKRVGLEPGYMMTGGVAKNPGAVREIEERLGEKIFICDEPEIVGATGAALYGFEEM